MTKDVETVRNVEDVACCFRSITQKGIRVLWEITSRCNLNCIHCLRVVKKPSEELSTSEAKLVISQMSELGVKKLMFSGGEPLLRKDIFELVKDARDRKIHVDLLTNATTIDKTIINKLLNAGLTELSVSLDGSTVTTHDHIRNKKGVFNKTVEAIEILINAGLNVDIATVISKINFREISDIIDLVYNLDADSITFNDIVFQSNAIKFQKELKLSEPDYEYIKKIVIEKRNEYKDKFPIRTIRLIKVHPLDSCGAAETLMTIDPLGNVNPCTLLHVSLNEGLNLKKMSLNDIWNSTVFTNIRKKIKSKKVCDEKCKMWDICGKGCRGLCQIYYNDIYAPDPVCSLL